MTYTCNDGYEFRGEPVAVPSPVTWIPFSGAEYYQGWDTSADSWQAARVKCLALGGDLVSINSLEVQQFLNETFQDLDKKKWIGGRLVGSGTYEWVNGATVEFKHFKSGLSPSLECLAMGSEDDGKWEDQDCTKSDIDRFICQKGSSSLSPSGKKKRETSDVDVGGNRVKRSLDLEKERKMSCVASGNSSAHWSYEHEVPRQCYGMLTHV